MPQLVPGVARVGIPRPRHNDVGRIFCAVRLTFDLNEPCWIVDDDIADGALLGESLVGIAEFLRAAG